jgi:hypothetical protein
VPRQGIDYSGCQRGFRPNNNEVDVLLVGEGRNRTDVGR